MTRQTSVQLTEATERQADALRARGFGTFTDIVRLAIDRMYNQEVRTMETKARAIVAVVGGDVNECLAWLNDGDGDVMPLEECIEEWREVGATYQA